MTGAPRPATRAPSPNPSSASRAPSPASPASRVLAPKPFKQTPASNPQSRRGSQSHEPPTISCTPSRIETSRPISRVPSFIPSASSHTRSNSNPAHASAPTYPTVPSHAHTHSQSPILSQAYTKAPTHSPRTAAAIAHSAATPLPPSLTSRTGTQRGGYTTATIYGHDRALSVAPSMARSRAATVEVSCSSGSSGSVLVCSGLCLVYSSVLVGEVIHLVWHETTSRAICGPLFCFGFGFVITL